LLWNRLLLISFIPSFSNFSTFQLFNFVMKPLVLILCTGNSCRSHIAEGILRAAAGDLIEVASAGSKPAGYVHPKSIQVLKEIGIDISGHHSKHMNEFLDRPVDTVITVCGNADQACPMFPGQMHRFHWGFDDPAHATGTEEEVLNEFRRVRDQIKLVFEAYASGLRRGQTLTA
jgi:arsenate reductase